MSSNALINTDYLQANDGCTENTIDSGKKHKCSVEGCNAVFFKPSNLQYHMNVHQNLRPLTCNLADCDRAYSSPSHLNRHIQQNHSKKIIAHKFKCKYCNNYFSSPSNLKRHVTNSHSESSKFCEECNLRFRSEKLYLEHAKQHSTQGINSEAYECELCGHKLSNARAFKRHKYYHTKTLYHCPYENCSAEFYTASLLSEHKKSCHFSVYECAHCAKQFSKKTNLKFHILTHSEERSVFLCSYKSCDKSYHFKKNLQQHIQRQHLGNKFPCEICGLVLSSKQKLDYHVTKIHVEGGKKFKCEVCNKELSSKQRLDVHMTKIHIEGRKRKKWKKKSTAVTGS